MKRLLALVVPLIAIGFCIGCKNAKDVSVRSVAVDRYISRQGLNISNDGVFLANAEAIEAAFTLDYRPLKPEGEDAADVLSAAALAGGAAEATGRGTIVGGGLRKLSDYKTVYFDPAKERSKIEAIRAAQEKASENEGSLLNAKNTPLTVIDWGPRGDYSAAVQRPSIYVMFSQPMTALASLGQQSSTSTIVSIYPPIKGTFRWYGTSFLSFEGDEPCQSQQIYTITVSANAASIYGTKISGDRTFTFTTETLSIRALHPDQEFLKRNNFTFNNNNIPPEAAKQIEIFFNYPVQVASLEPYLEITVGNDKRKFNLVQGDQSFKLKATLLDPVPFDTEVKVTLKQGAKSQGGTRGTEADQSRSFRTPAPFKVDSIRRTAGYGKYSNMVEINFSHDVNRETVLRAISTDPAMTITDDNLEMWGSYVRLYNLPVGFGSKFTVQVATNVEDVFGRNLSEKYSAEITMPSEPPPEGDARFLDYGQAILEAQFPPRFLFEYKNIASGSMYRIGSTDNPWAKSPAGLTPIHLTPGKANQKYFEEIDLSPYLKASKLSATVLNTGFVYFDANLQLLRNERRDNDTYRTTTSSYENKLNIQVTDLGMTVRYGFNKAVVLVTSLSTGSPVPNVQVRLLSPDKVKSGVDLSNCNYIGEASTDKNGLAVINLDPGSLRRHTETDSNWWYNEPYVIAEKNGDKVVYSPSSHSTWSFGVSSEMPQRAEVVKPVAFMFTDRGLYKPGETLSFRGVDRSKVLGMYTIYEGPYVVNLEQDIYRSTPIATIIGETSESGGLYGTITIPEDAEPGSYRLVYRRIDGETTSDIIANVPVTIAFFERLKFQATLTAPQRAIISGDDVSMTLQASYLSGGSLSGASWEGAWYSEMASFRGGADTKGYSFGPCFVWDSKRYIASEGGTLTGQGTATLSQKTGSGSVTGAPYTYQAEARVTDISNQMISAGRSVMVHPASFYIGLNRGGRGFATKGQEQSFDFIAVNTSGEKVSGNGLYLQSGEDAGQMTVELLREEWRRVQQRGVNGYVYDEYSREQVVDSTQKVSLRGGSGSIKVKPSQAGYHTLRVSAKDREGRTALTEINFYVTGSGGYWNMSSPTEIRLTPDQDMYNPGDTAKILLQSTLPAGNYLITVEREGIFTEEVRSFSEPVTVIDIPIARNYVPVVYVAVSSYSIRSGPPTHEYGEPDLDKPKGHFGVTKIKVNPRTRAFTVKVDSDKKSYRPGEEVTMTLTATRDGQPLPNAELTLMAVDRGVLDLINYHVPDPISYFYNEGRFPLSVYGGDSRVWLMDPVTYSVKNLAGGDDEGDGKIEERKDFNPTAVFEPMLLTDETGKVTCKFKLPDNLTTYRITVFGVTGDIFALKESEIAAQNRINVREVLPRRTRERDTAEAGVLITNLDSASHVMNIKLDIGQPLPDDDSSGMKKVPGQAFVDGVAERRVTVKSGENAVVYFDVAAVREGTVTLNFTVSSDILNEKLIRELIIEHPYVMETVTTTGTIDKDEGSEGLVIPSFADNGAGSLSLTMDATRLSLLDDAISYLFRYPYGCMEQRSSAVMPLVVFGDYLDALGIRSEVSDPRKVVENELRSWAKVQLPSGGFPYWPSGTEGNFYVSLRIAHIIAIAKAKKFNVPSSLKVPALTNYLTREYQLLQRLERNSSYYYSQSYQQSYMLYVMALLGENVDPSRLAEILTRDNVDASVLAFVGMTYRALGNNAEAANVATRLRNLVRMSARGADITDPLAQYTRNYYGNQLEQLALTLQFFVEQFPGDEINTRLLYSLLESNKSTNRGYWGNTATTVRVLAAVDALIRAENLTNLDVSGSISLAGNELLAGTFKGLGAKPVTGTFDFKDEGMAGLARDKMQSLDFKRRGRFNIYYTASLRYAIPSELQSFRDEGIGVFLSIYDINTGEEVKGTNLQTGKTYRARVRVSSNRDRTYLALRVPVPSGAEIIDATFVTSASYEDKGGASGEDAGYSRSWISHQLILDNEIQYFWNNFYKGESNVSFLFRTARRGVYPTPPVQAECMYEAEVFGRSTGLIYTIE